MSFNIEDPVVVNPEIVSKKESVKFGIDPLRINGKHPKKENTTQTSETIIKPSLFPISLLALEVRRTRAPPVPMLIAADIMNANTSCSL